MNIDNICDKISNITFDEDNKEYETSVCTLVGYFYTYAHINDIYIQSYYIMDFIMRQDNMTNICIGNDYIKSAKLINYVGLNMFNIRINTMKQINEQIMKKISVDTMYDVEYDIHMITEVYDINVSNKYNNMCIINNNDTSFIKILKYLTLIMMNIKQEDKYYGTIYMAYNMLLSLIGHKHDYISRDRYETDKAYIYITFIGVEVLKMQEDDTHILINEIQNIFELDDDITNSMMCILELSGMLIR